MALNKSQIISILKKNKLNCYPLDKVSVYVPTTDRKKTLLQIYGMFLESGAKPITKSKYSGTGAVQVGHFNIVVTRDKYLPKSTGGKDSNKSVQNRLEFSLLLRDVIANTLRPLNIMFDGGKKVKFDGIMDAKFLGDGVSDFALLKGTKKIPVSINMIGGSYRHQIEGRYLDLAYDALEKAAEDEVLEADVDGNDYMTLYSPLAFEADTRCTRELIFDDIRGGFGLIGDFSKGDYSYAGKSNTLTVKSKRAFITSSDLKSTDKPFFILTSGGPSQIGELKGFQLDLVPKSALPKNTTIVNL